MTLNLPLLYFVWTEEYCQTNPNKKQIAKPLTRNKHLSLLYFCLGCCYFSSVSHFKRVILRFTSYYHSNCYFEWSVSSDYSGPFSVPNQQKNISFYVQLYKCEKDRIFFRISKAWKWFTRFVGFGNVKWFCLLSWVIICFDFYRTISGS